MLRRVGTHGYSLPKPFFHCPIFLFKNPKNMEGGHRTPCTMIHDLNFSIWSLCNDSSGATNTVDSLSQPTPPGTRFTLLCPGPRVSLLLSTTSQGETDVSVHCLLHCSTCSYSNRALHNLLLKSYFCSWILLCLILLSLMNVNWCKFSFHNP